MTVFAVACSNEGGKQPIDASIQLDAPKVDAMVDAPIDAAPTANEQACKAACDKFAMCAMLPPEPQCYAECGADLVDCTPAQVQEVGACAALDCGADPDTGPFVTCLTMITCIMP